MIRVGGRSRRTTRRERRVNRLRQRVRIRGGVTVKKPRRVTGPVVGQRPRLGPRFGWLRFTRWQCSLFPRELYSFCIVFFSAATVSFLNVGSIKNIYSILLFETGDDHPPLCSPLFSHREDVDY